MKIELPMERLEVCSAINICEHLELQDWNGINVSMKINWIDIDKAISRCDTTSQKLVRSHGLRSEMQVAQEKHARFMSSCVLPGFPHD